MVRIRKFVEVIMVGTTTDGTGCDHAAIVRELPYLRRFARALTSGASNADDLVHECVVNALRNSSKFEPGTNLRAWLFTILRNSFISDIRRNRHRLDTTNVPQWACGGISPASQEDAIMLRHLRDALAHLPKEQNAVLMLVALEGMSYEQTAKILSVPVGTVRSRLSRARHALKIAMEGDPRSAGGNPPRGGAFATVAHAA